MEEYGKPLLYLALYGLVPYLLKEGLKVAKLNVADIASQLGKLLMSLPNSVVMILMALPEHAVLETMEPNMPLVQRLLVSLAMYAIHFAWNGIVITPENSYDELVSIMGTALYALNVLCVKRQTAVALVAADAVMTLVLRGLL